MNVSSLNEPRKYLIAIGSPHCPNIIAEPLKRVENDIEKINNIFIKEQGYERVFTKKESLGCVSAKIKSELSSWFRKDERSPSDQVIVYYAGHGDGGREHGSHYLYTIESKIDELYNTAIKTSDLAECLFPGQPNSPQNVLLILDVCYAGQGAINTIVSSLTQCQAATQNVSFWIIASANSKTEAGDGDFVDALEKVMKDDCWKQKDKDEFISIEQLVGCINTYWKNNNNPQRAECRCIQSIGQSNFLRNPFFFRNQLESDEHKLKGNSTKRQFYQQNISDLLHLLDYSDQEQDFKNVMKGCKERAFLIQTDNKIIQHWLVRRLAGCVSGFGNAKKIEIEIGFSMRSGIDNFWLEFNKQMKIENEVDQNTVIQQLANLCKTQSVIIAIYGLSSLSKEKVQNFHNFWSDLINKTRSISTQERDFRSRLVLLIAEKNDRSVLNKLKEFNFSQPPAINELSYSISLTPLESILGNDVESWLAQDNVYKFINRKEDEIQLIVQDIQNWGEEPFDVLNEICRTVFQFETGIVPIADQYWKLA